MPKSRILSIFPLGLCLMTALLAQTTNFPPGPEQIPGPTEQAAWCCFLHFVHSFVGDDDRQTTQTFQPWLADIKHWRRERLMTLGYQGFEYDRPELRWTQSSFIQPQMMAQERYFYDPVLGRYTVDRYLDDLEKRYGGIDSVLIWPTYPNLGIDNRNEFDLIGDMPGGLAGLRSMVSDFHKRGVRVLFAYNPWDMGTRTEGSPDWETVAGLMAAIGADGINGDTMHAVPPAFRKASDAIGHPLAFEPEEGDQGDADAAIEWNNMSWGYWEYPFVPMISKNKWLEPRHMVHVSNRWARRKTDDLQYAFFNGTGYQSWENVWGIWNGIVPQDAEALRRISKIERAFAGLLTSKDWEPHTHTLRYGLYASKFPGDGQMLWTFVNRNQYDLEGEQIELPYQAGWHYYDLWNGKELESQVNGNKVDLSFEIEGNGFGAILATMQPASESISTLLSKMNVLARAPLKSLSLQWQVLHQQMIEISRTPVPRSAPANMVTIPEGDFEFRTTGIMIEGGEEGGTPFVMSSIGTDEGADVQFPWEDSPRRYHLHKMHLHSFYIDKYPVSNADFKKFLDATHYHPTDDHNFLRDWKNGSYRDGWANKPVTWVSLDDARAYAVWAGKRLPHEWEWQYAAQGTDSRVYPWGNEWNASAVPATETGNDIRPPTNVDAFPKGESPFGVMDLVANVWQWTDEFVDDHTRAAILKGGSYYQPQGSKWYFPQAYKLTEHGKYLLMSPSIDRSGTVGFRCVEDSK
jgi:formylglycine-generating enzyme required for sulfatase activity